MRIHFEDQGQDFLWFDLSEEGLVLDAGPSQAWFWKDRVGRIVRQDGKRWFEFGDAQGISRVISYPISRVQKILHTA